MIKARCLATLVSRVSAYTLGVAQKVSHLGIYLLEVLKLHVRRIADDAVKACAARPLGVENARKTLLIVEGIDGFLLGFRG